MSTMNLSDAVKSGPLGKAGLSKHSRVLIVGLGKTGLSVARCLTRHGIRFAVVDSRESPPGLNELRGNHPDAAVFVGGFDQTAFQAATDLIVSPGLPLDLQPIRAAVLRGTRVLGDGDLFACEARAPIIGITGSNGKSTVTTLLGRMAELDGRKARVGGNLGVPMLDLLASDTEVYILELSSFQLERSELLDCAAATVLNVTPDHMDRYESLESYAKAKARIFRGDGTMVLNRDDPTVAAMGVAGRPCLWFGLENDSGLHFRVGRMRGEDWLFDHEVPVVRVSEVRIRGRHNLSNALAALALGSAYGLGREAMAEALQIFGGLEHRMQWVAEIDQVAYVNDSKATNVGACLAALSGLTERAVLIAGGDGKGADFSPLAPVAAEKVRAAVLMGRDAPLLEEIFRDVIPVTRVKNMREAVAAARNWAQPGDTVLLAPACASLDQYRDYQERGQVFVDAVKGLLP